MAPETLIFMPNGDLTLTLIRHVIEEEDTAPSTSQATTLAETPIDDDDGPGPSGLEPEESYELDESALYFAPDPPEEVNGTMYPPPPRAQRGSNASRRERSASPPASFWASLRRQAAKAIDPEDEEVEMTTQSPTKNSERTVKESHEVHCVVSSRHMMLASQYFERILSGNSSEALTLRTTGHVTIPLPDDMDAMIILFNIIHGASRKVPRQVSLEVLSKLAVAVSKFEVLETVGYFSDTWIDHLRGKGLPTLYNDQVISMTFVFWAFDRPTEFKDMTRLAQRECNEKVDEDVRDVPIPHRIIDAIKRDRVLGINTAIKAIQTIIDRYMAGKTVCDGSLDDELRYACDSMVLGCLMNSSRKICIWPEPEVPFTGRNFKDVARAIRTIRILDVCNKTSNRKWNSHGPSSNCHGLEDSIEASMKSIEADLDGLDLSSYARESDDYSFSFPASPVTSPTGQMEEAEDDRGHFQAYTKEEVIEEPAKEVRTFPRRYSGPDSRSNSRFSERIDYTETEEPTREQRPTSPIPNEHLGPFFRTEVRSSSRPNSWVIEAPAQPEVQEAPRQYPRGSQQAETRPHKSNVQEHDKSETRTISRDSPIQESRIFTNVMAKIIEEPLKEEAPPASEEVTFPEHRKINGSNTFRKISTEDSKPPLQLSPRVGSIEEMIEEDIQLGGEGVRTSIESRGSLSGIQPVIEEVETRTPLKGFKMRKSKKTFSARY